MTSNRELTDDWSERRRFLDQHWHALVEQAVKVRELAYAPYSEFKVGAALLTGAGRIVVGCNVENASYGLSICAERSALVSAVSLGIRDFVGVAVVADPCATPCGACRQFLFQFGDQILVRAFSPREPAAFREFTSGELLPQGFRF